MYLMNSGKAYSKQVECKVNGNLIPQFTEYNRALLTGIYGSG